jgi:hypothetical protein
MVCSTANIVQLLATKPGVLTPEQVRDASSQLDAHLARRTTPLPAPARSRRRLVTPRPRPKARRPRRGRQHHKKSEIGRLAVAIGLVALLIFAPQVVISFGEVVAQFLVGQASSTK